MNDKPEWLLSEALPHVAMQIRLALSNIHLALNRLAPPDQRDGDTRLDENAAWLEQSYYRLLRLAKDLDEAPLLLRQEPLPMGNLDLVVWLDEVIRQAEPLFATRGVQLEIRCQERYVITAVNEHWLTQALWHLLSNALCATPKGGTVAVTLAVQQRSVLLRVADTGSGIRPEQMETLHDGCGHPENWKWGTSGLGLGLPLVQHIAHLHGGQLLLESHDGTRITLVLPLRRTENVLAQPATDYAGGFQPALLELSDGLPAQAFLIKHLDQ